MTETDKLAKAGEAMKGQTQQDELRRPEDLGVVGAKPGENPQADQGGTKRPGDGLSARR